MSGIALLEGELLMGMRHVVMLTINEHQQVQGFDFSVDNYNIDPAPLINFEHGLYWSQPPAAIQRLCRTLNRLAFIRDNTLFDVSGQFNGPADKKMDCVTALMRVLNTARITCPHLNFSAIQNEDQITKAIRNIAPSLSDDWQNVGNDSCILVNPTSQCVDYTKITGLLLDKLQRNSGFLSLQKRNKTLIYGA